MCVYVCIYIYIYIYIDRYRYIYMYMYICMSREDPPLHGAGLPPRSRRGQATLHRTLQWSLTQRYVYIYIYIYIVYVYRYIYIYIHMFVNIYLHIQCMIAWGSLCQTGFAISHLVILTLLYSIIFYYVLFYSTLFSQMVRHFPTLSSCAITIITPS